MLSLVDTSSTHCVSLYAPRAYSMESLNASINEERSKHKDDEYNVALDRVQHLGNVFKTDSSPLIILLNEYNVFVSQDDSFAIDTFALYVTDRFVFLEGKTNECKGTKD